MALFSGGNTGFRSTGSLFGSTSSSSSVMNANKNDVEVPSPPTDSIQTLKFSPSTLQQNFLAACSWDGSVRCWEVNLIEGKAHPKAAQNHGQPALDLDWTPCGTKIMVGGADSTVKMWDLASNSYTQIGAHDAPVKAVNFINGGNYQCIMSCGWDNKIKFWDGRTPNPIETFTTNDKVYCADVMFPMAVVCTANRGCIVYNLEGKPQQYQQKTDINLKYQFRTAAVFPDTKTRLPAGFAIGSIEGRVAITYVPLTNPKDNFTFKCHRVDQQGNVQDIYAVNGCAFHPVHATLATVGSDGRYSFWDKDNRTKLKNSEPIQQPITTCAISSRGELFAYALGYDWSKGVEGMDPNKKPAIYITSAGDDMKPRPKSK